LLSSAACYSLANATAVLLSLLNWFSKSLFFLDLKNKAMIATCDLGERSNIRHEWLRARDRHCRSYSLLLSGSAIPVPISRTGFRNAIPGYRSDEQRDPIN
jgi:hypothetical protein